MTPGARVAATIELLDEIVSQAERPADLVANAYFRARRYIGGGDRRAVSDRVWGILRRWGQLRWWLKRTRHPADQTNALPRGIVAADLMVVEGMTLGDVEAMFDGGRYRPDPLDDGERRALRQMEGHSLPPSRAARLGAAQRPGMGGAASPGGLRRGLGPRDRRAREAAAGRPARQPPEGHRRRGARRAGARGHRDRADALCPRRPAPEAPPVGRGGRGLPERPGRDPGRGLAARRRPGRRPARHADRRLLRRRRRQDAGHRRRHEQQGPRRRHGRLREPARPLGPAPAPRRRAQCRAPRARRRQPQMAEAPGRRLRPRAGRRALHRHRHLAPQSRRPLDAAARGSRRAGAQAGRHPRRRGAPGEAGRRAGLRHLLGAAGRERAADRGLPRAPSRVRRRARGRRLARRHGRRAAARDRRALPAPVAAASWHRRLLRRDAGAQARDEPEAAPGSGAEAAPLGDGA